MNEGIGKAVVSLNSFSKKKEKELLQEFWWYASQNTDKEARLELLKKFARIRIERPFGWNPGRIRQSWNNRRSTDWDKCFPCLKKSPNLVTHHIIRIYFGGSNSNSNRVTVCGSCHASIHPWLRHG